MRFPADTSGEGAVTGAMECLVSSNITSPSMVLIPADMASIPVVRAAIREALRERGWSDDSVRRITLVTNEAVANAVEHGSLPGELVEVVYQVDIDEARIRILDSGAGKRWDPPAAPCDPPAHATRGRGLSIIAALTDRVEFRSTGRGTELRLDFVRAA